MLPGIPTHPVYAQATQECGCILVRCADELCELDRNGFPEASRLVRRALVPWNASSSAIRVNLNIQTTSTTAEPRKLYSSMRGRLENT